MKKIINVHFPYDLWKKMAEFVLKINYPSRTAFILDAVREKMERMEDKYGNNRG